jgi:hypothetical protein
LNIKINNLCLGLELTSPVYVNNNDTACHVSPSQQTDTGAIMEACFGMAIRQDDFKGALLYKLRRKYTNRTDSHLNSSSTKDMKNTCFFGSLAF